MFHLPFLYSNIPSRHFSKLRNYHKSYLRIIPPSADEEFFLIDDVIERLVTRHLIGRENGISVASAVLWLVEMSIQRRIMIHRGEAWFSTINRSRSYATFVALLCRIVNVYCHRSLLNYTKFYTRWFARYMFIYVFNIFSGWIERYKFLTQTLSRD